MSAAVDLDGFFCDVARHLGGTDALPEGVRLGFALDGPGGGSWVLETGIRSWRIARGDHPRCDCRLACTVDDFSELVDGRLRPRDGFFQGRLEVEGDVGLVIRLRRALVRLSEQRASMPT